MKHPLHEVGEIVVCPDCKFQIAEVIAPIFFGDRLLACCFRWIDKAIENGAPATCPKCRAPFFMSGKLHVQGRGWC